MVSNSVENWLNIPTCLDQGLAGLSQFYRFKYMRLLCLVLVLFSVCVAYSTIGDPEDQGMEYSYPSSIPVKIDSTRLGYCMAFIASKQYPNYKFSNSGIDCTWRSTVPVEERIKSNYPSQWEYLAAKDWRKCDFSTGHEEDLKKWVLSQPDNSIDMLKIFSRSLDLNGGNIKAALITIHTLLRNNARFWDYNGTRYFYKTTPNEAKTFFNKFIDIRGDLAERGSNFVGDHKGTWYRIWGAMLGRLILYTDSTLQFNNTRYLCADPRGNASDKIYGFFTNFISETGIYVTEVMNKNFFSDKKEVDKYKVESSRQGAKTAEYLVKGLSDHSIFGLEGVSESSCKPDSYLSNR